MVFTVTVTLIIWSIIVVFHDFQKGLMVFILKFNRSFSGLAASKEPFIILFSTTRGNFHVPVFLFRGFNRFMERLLIVFFQTTCLDGWKCFLDLKLSRKVEKTKMPLRNF